MSNNNSSRKAPFVLWVVAVVALMASGLGLQQALPLHLHGVSTSGVVEEVEVRSSSAGSGKQQVKYRTTVRYQTAEGKVHHTTFTSDRPEHHSGQLVPLRYVAHDPGRVALASQPVLAGPIAGLVLGLALLVTALLLPRLPGAQQEPVLSPLHVPADHPQPASPSPEPVGQFGGTAPTPGLAEDLTQAMQEVGRVQQQARELQWKGRQFLEQAALLLMGVFLLGMGVYQFKDHPVLLWRGVQATGVVLSPEEARRHAAGASLPQNTFGDAVVQFETRQGDRHILHVMQPPAGQYRTGEQVQVRYDPQQPRRARVFGDLRPLLEAGFYLLLGLFALGCFWFARTLQGWQRPARF